MQDKLIAAETELLAEQIASSLISELTDDELAQVSGGGDTNR